MSEERLIRQCAPTLAGIKTGSLFPCPYETREELMADLTKRLGINILRVEVGSIDFLRDMAMLKVYYSALSIDTDLDQKIRLTREDQKQFTP